MTDAIQYFLQLNSLDGLGDKSQGSVLLWLYRTDAVEAMLEPYLTVFATLSPGTLSRVRPPIGAHFMAFLVQISSQFVFY